MRTTEEGRRARERAPQPPRLSDLQSALISPIDVFEQLIRPKFNGANPLKSQMEEYRRSISQMTTIENFDAWTLEAFLIKLVKDCPALSRPVKLALRELHKWKKPPCEGEWETTRASNLHNVYGLDGAFTRLGRWEELHKFPLHHGDFIVGMEHGPTVTLPLVAAIRQKVFRPGGVLAHIDAHKDDFEDQPSASITPTGIRMSAHMCSATQTRLCIEEYLRATDDETGAAFDELVSVVRHDISTFLWAVSPYISAIGAAIRRQYTGPGQAVIYPFSKPVDYLVASPKRRASQSLIELLLSTDPTKDIIFSLDGDALGVRREDRFWQSRRYRTRADWLFSALEAHAKWYAAQPDHGSILYTLSVDPDWVNQPAKVRADFVQFYTHILRRTLRALPLETTGKR